VIDLSAPDPTADLHAVRAELEAYDPALGVRPALVVGTKADLLRDPERAAAPLGPAAVVVSGTTGVGLETLTERLSALVREAVAAEPERQPYVVLRPARPPFVVTREGERFRVRGRGVERWVAETDFDDEAAVTRLQARLVKVGVERQLAAAGAHRGDEVAIGDRTFEFVPEEDRDGQA
jgi:GTP-binding protein